MEKIKEHTLGELSICSEVRLAALYLLPVIAMTKFANVLKESLALHFIRHVAEMDIILLKL